MNRKLIRTTLAQVKEKGRDIAPPKPRPAASSAAPPAGGSADAHRPAARPGGAPPPPRASYAPSSASVQVRKRVPPPAETNAEIYYYKKQMDAHIPMVLVLTDGEEIEGTIEWYDRNAFKVNRKSEPNLLVLKQHVKYMFKAEDREAE
ncbi:MAG: hypothetical protein ABR577_08295 [Pyrinomonadaceae bacterium]